CQLPERIRGFPSRSPRRDQDAEHLWELYLLARRRWWPFPRQAGTKSLLSYSFSGSSSLAELPNDRGNTGRARWHALCARKVTPPLHRGKSCVNGPEKRP